MFDVGNTWGVITGGDGRSASSLAPLIDSVGIPAEVLYVGDFDAPLLDPDEHDSRICAEMTNLKVEPGVYGFRESGQWRFMVVRSEKGQASGEWFKSEQQAGSNRWSAAFLAQLGWEQGRPFRSTPPKYATGDAVRIEGSSGEVGTVVADPVTTDREFVYRVRFGSATRTVPESGLLPVADVSSPLTWREFPSADLTDITTLITLVKTQQPLSDVVYSFGATRTVFRPYQFKPLLKLLQTNNSRLLIADEVGLGKTIEAGLIWTELNQRVGIRRGLVVCPAALTRKWEAEMRRRFGVELVLAGRAQLERFADMLEEGHDAPLQAVVSLESLRNAQVLERLIEFQPRFDLIVVDEAHYLRNRNTRSFDLGEQLSDWADVLLFLSATPLNLGTRDLFNLLNLLAGDQFPDEVTFDDQLAPNWPLHDAARLLEPHRASFAATIDRLLSLEDVPLGRTVLAHPQISKLLKRLEVPADLSVAELADSRRALLSANTLSSTVTRTRKVDVPDAKATRVSDVINVEWTSEELAFYNAVLAWARARALASNGVVGFATVMPLRHAASCIPAMRQLLEQKYEITEDDDDFDDEIDPWEAFVDGELSAEALTTLGLRQALAAVGNTDSKFDMFLAKLREIQASGIDQIMVFSFFRRTLAYLQERLRGEFRVRVMDGSVPPAQRAGLMESYRRGDFDILLLSEVGSEGLDFEFVGALINYDLPWNPMRVEQRIGRLDRFGQTHERIFIYNFHVPGTIETDIFERLYERIQVFKESIGELEPILRNEVSEITRMIVDPRRSDEERRAEMDRIALAVENKRADLNQLQESAAGLLTGLDQMLIDGFEDQIIGAGKFVGSTEVLGMVKRFVEAHGAQMRSPTSGSVIEIRGSDDLAQRLVQIGRRRDDRKIEDLSRKLRAGESIFVIFDSQKAISVSAELVTVGHPLMTAATQEVAEVCEPQWRYGSVKVTGVPQGRYAALLAVVEVTGAEPARELVGVALDPDLSTADQVIDALLRSAANGLLRPAESSGIDEVTVATLERLMHERRHAIERERSALNDAQIAARSETIRNTFNYKISKAQHTLDLVRRDGRASSILRIYEGQISNLKTRLAADLKALDTKRKLTVTWEPVALLEVEGVG